jgi:mannose-6-phosphate isomerase-like protein (cupin superfamily)
MIITKVWGCFKRLLSQNGVEVDRLEIAAGGYSSIHLHVGKWNRFFVESGELQLSAYGEAFVLKTGQSYTIPPGVRHQFKALTNCVVYEMYWCEDIVRFSEGGVDDVVSK